ncbi:MAG: hypothetical protein Q8S27_16120 [Hoeflea sp.]|nr:hypothetical protein [Hoeflea sp.]
MHLMFLFLAVLFWVPQWAWAKPQCEQDYAIWVSEADGVRHIVYGSEEVRYYSNVYFEEWRQSKLAWRSKGMVTCSNGAVICYANVENASDLGGDDATTSVVIEEIDENADGLPEWVVFAGLGQSIYYDGGAKVEWFNGFGLPEDDRVTMPNVYRFLSCRERRELVLSNPADDSWHTLLEELSGKSEDRRVLAFITATYKPTARMDAVLAGMGEFVSFEEMIRDGRISSPSDCLPEFRTLCFDTLQEPKGDTVIQEWGEWVDNIPSKELPEYVELLMRAAAQRGFNLLTDEELAAVE